MWDMLKPLIEKATLGTITRGMLWIIAFVAAKTGVESPGDDVATKIGVWATAVVMALIAVVWSKIKDNKNLKTDPPK